MNNQQNKQETISFIRMIVIFIMFMIPFYLVSYNQVILACLYIILISSIIIWKTKSNIKNKIISFFSDNKDIKNLKYYYITDDKKIIDLEIRKYIFSFLKDFTGIGTLFFMINHFAFYYLFKEIFSEVAFLESFLVVGLIIIAIGGYGSMVVGFIYKHPVITYVLVPIASLLLYIGFFDTFTIIVPDFVKFMIYLGFSLLLYLLLSLFLPTHILRKLTNKTVLISSLLTICISFLSQISSFYVSSYIQEGNHFLTLDQVKSATDVSDTLKNLILDNPELVGIINYFFENEISNQLASILGIITTAITLSYIIGGLLISRKTKKYSSKAKTIYRNLIMNKSEIDYSCLIQCAYYGGEEYENLILNNIQMRNYVFDNEFHLEIPKISLKTKFIDWLKKNSISYKTYIEIRDAFNHISN